MINQRLNIVILAAGRGTRMHSDRPKVLHQVAGRAILSHVIACAEQLGPERVVVVYGFGGEIENVGGFGQCSSANWSR